RRRALPAAGAGGDDHGPGSLHAAGEAAVRSRSGVAVEQTLAYGVLVALAIAVLSPFYWMIITSFMSEAQMRRVVSFFCPEPSATENYQQLLAKTEFAAWYGN